MSLLTRPPGEGPVPALEIPSRRGWPVHPGPVLLVATLLVAPVFLDEYWTFNVMVGLALGIACLGLQVLVGWSRQISLMHAGVVGASVYIGNRTMRALQFRQETYDYEPAGAGWLLIAAAAIGFAVAVYLAVGLVARRLALPYVLALTYAVQFAIENKIFTRSRLGSGLSAPSMPRPAPFGISLESDTRFYYFLAAVLIAVLVALHRLRGSRFGRAIVFAAGEPEAAAAAGVAPWRYRAVAWGVAGACAGVSGLLQGPMYRNPPGILQYISFNSVFYLAVVVLAGSASLIATVVVAVAMQLIPQIFLDLKLNVYLIGGVGMAVGVMLGPRGFGGAVIDLFDRPRAPRVLPEIGAAVEGPADGRVR